MSCRDFASSENRRLRDQLRILSQAPPAAPGRALGIECEYVVYEDGSQIHFGDLILQLTRAFPEVATRESGHRLRLPTGHLLYSDGWYAELATPPEPVQPGVTTRLTAGFARAQEQLLDLLARYSAQRGVRYTLTGTSLHINVECPRGSAAADLSTRFALAYGPLMVFLTGFAGSSGLLVRPRHGRLEVATEYVPQWPRFRATLSLFYGAFLSSLKDSPNGLPQLPLTTLEGSPVRRGWLLRRSNVSTELIRAGRNAPVTLHDGRSLSIQQVLDASWTRIGPHLEATLSASEVALAEEFILGRRKGGVELPAPQADSWLQKLRRIPQTESLGERLFSRSLASRRLGPWSLQPAYVDWGFMIYAARKNGRQFFLNLPLTLLGEFGEGVFDAVLIEALDRNAQAGTGQVLAKLSDTAQPGIFTSILASVLSAQLGRAAVGKKKKPPGPCTAVLEGPDCVCIGEMATYFVRATCPGTCSSWSIDHTDVAVIDSVAGCTATVRVLKQGVFEISCDFTAATVFIHLTKKVKAHGVFHVLGGTTDTVVSTVPLIQPHPFVQFERPVESATGDCLINGDDFVVHERELRSGFDRLHDTDAARRISLEQVTKEHLMVELKIEGTIADFFQEILACGWIVESDGGRKVSRGTFQKNVEFGDSWFRSRIPGELQTDPRVIVITGVGKHEIRVWAENAIARSGTDWITVRVGLRESARREIADRQRHLANLLREGPGLNPPAVHAQRVLAARLAVESAYLDGLLDPCLQVEWNYQDAQAFALTERERTRTQGRYADPDGPDELPATVSTEVELQSQILKRERPQIYLTHDPVESYWVVPENYSGTRYQWDPDGLLRGRRDTLLTSEFECCKRENPIFGVEALVPECATINTFDQPITLRADGRPEAVDGVPGLYRWSVIAKPNVSARVELTPTGWTPSKSVELKVDTRGRYTVKVEYQLGGRYSSLTYAVADLKVLVPPAQKLKWRLVRTGDYSGV